MAGRRRENDICLPAQRQNAAKKEGSTYLLEDGALCDGALIEGQEYRAGNLSLPGSVSKEEA